MTERKSIKDVMKISDRGCISITPGELFQTKEVYEEMKRLGIDKMYEGKIVRSPRTKDSENDF